jgi:hypothetical protein
MKASVFLTTILITFFSFCSQKTKAQQASEKKHSSEIKKKEKLVKTRFDYCLADIKQGLYGCCTLRTGNCMPIIDTNKCKWYGIKKIIFVYEATKESQTIKIGSNWYSKINTRLIAQTQSDSNGCYQIFLPAGKYSVLISENGKYYCTSWGSNKLLCPVTIDSNKVIKHDLLMNMSVN